MELLRPFGRIVKATKCVRILCVTEYWPLISVRDGFIDSTERKGVGVSGSTCM